ncbi:MAG TPA: hypothetical protein VIH61_03345, partial [Waddliaceae bacterium]
YNKLIHIVDQPGKSQIVHAQIAGDRALGSVSIKIARKVYPISWTIFSPTSSFFLICSMPSISKQIDPI